MGEIVPLRMGVKPPEFSPPVLPFDAWMCTACGSPAFFLVVDGPIRCYGCQKNIAGLSFSQDQPRPAA